MTLPLEMLYPAFTLVIAGDMAETLKNELLRAVNSLISKTDKQSI
jgi:hypothetical protein